MFNNCCCSSICFISSISTSSNILKNSLCNSFSSSVFGSKYETNGLALEYLVFVSSSLLHGDNNISSSFGDTNLYCLYLFSSIPIFGLKFIFSTYFNVSGICSKSKQIYSNFSDIACAIFFFSKTRFSFLFFSYLFYYFLSKISIKNS